MSTRPINRSRGRVRRMASGIIAGVAAAFLVTAGSELARAQAGQGTGRAAQGAAADVRVLKVRENVFMLSGAGGNITVLTFPQGVLLVDTGRSQMTDKVLAAVRQLSDKPIVHIINTEVDPDHTGGNDKLAQAGRRIPRDIVAADSSGAPEGPMIVAHENVANRMSAPTGNQAPAPVRAWPNETYHQPTMKLSTHFHGGEAIELFHEPAAHTDGDSVVYFRHADVMMTGDIFTTTNYPIIDIEKGGSISGIVDGLNHILDLAFADFRSEGGTMIVPGHGRLCDMSDVAYYRDMVTIIRDRVQSLMAKGMTLEQVKAAKPTRDYDPRYGSTTGPWTTDMFVEAVFKTLSAKKK
jgi:cyclase